MSLRPVVVYSPFASHVCMHVLGLVRACIHVCSCGVLGKDGHMREDGCACLPSEGGCALMHAWLSLCAAQCL